MQKFSAAFKVGIIVIAGLITCIVLVMKFSRDWGQKDGVVHLSAYFDDATGLTNHSQVRIAGIQIGEVNSIRLEGNRARVDFNVREDIVLYSGINDGSGLRNSATVSKKLSGILGDYVLEITPGIEGKRLADGDTMPLVLQDSGVQALLGNAETIMADVKTITGSLAQALGDGEGNGRMVLLLDNLNETMKSVRDLSRDNAEKINDIITHVDTITKEASTLMAAGNGEIPILLDELHATLKEMHNLMENTNENLNGVFRGTESPIRQLNDSMARLDRSLANIERVTERINNGEGSMGKLLSDDGIADEAQGLLSDTRALITSGNEIVDSAKELLKPITDMNVDLSLRGDYLVNANAMKVDFGVKLQSTEDKYYLIDLIMDPKGSSSTKSVMTYSSEKGPVYETVTTNDSSFKFSAQYAKRWRWFVGRFGIIENTGGLGGDLLLFHDNLQFKVDLFAFNDNEYPRLRGMGTMYFSLFMPWEWSKTFYITAGFDDPINIDEFDYFFGIGFRFTDNDLKSVLSMVPKP